MVFWPIEFRVEGVLNSIIYVVRHWYIFLRMVRSKMWSLPNRLYQKENPLEQLRFRVNFSFQLPRPNNSACSAGGLVSDCNNTRKSCLLYVCTGTGSTVSCSPCSHYSWFVDCTGCRMSQRTTRCMCRRCAMCKHVFRLAYDMYISSLRGSFSNPEGNFTVQFTQYNVQCESPCSMSLPVVDGTVRHQNRAICLDIILNNWKL